MFSSIKRKIRFDTIHVVIIVSILLWGFAFRGFLTNNLMLDSDARQYYEHTKFYLLNISRGVYPLWEHTRRLGVPVEFFMRRIGSFNPVFFLILVLDTIGLSYTAAYMTFLGIYYLLGMVGFYLLARKIFNDSNIAFVAYLLLTFSSLGTRMFDTYFNLVLIPMIWFFYFLVAFAQRQEKHFFLGMTFTLMILVSTYIPFYFLTIFLLFLVCYAIFYFRSLIDVSKQFLKFIKSNKVLVSLCVIAVILSLVPGVILQKSLSKEDSEIVLPNRHHNYEHTPPTGPGQLVVDIQTVIQWGIIEDFIYSTSLTDFRKFRFAIFYMPIFAYIVFLLGIFTRLNKKLVFFFVFFFFVLLLGAPHKVSFHNFLREHIFYFKYFRNLHFFLWLILLPLFVLFLAEQFRAIISYEPRTKKEKWGLLAFLAIVHAGIMFYLLTRGDAILSSFFVVGLSFVFFVLYFSGKFKAKRNTFLFVILMLVTAQPLEVYHYFSKNAIPPYNNYVDPYRYRSTNAFLSPPIAETQSDDVVQEPDSEGELPDSFVEKKDVNIYMGTVWYIYLYGNLLSSTIDKYTNRVILLYDNVEFVDDDDPDLERIGLAFERNQNLAFVSGDSSKMPFLSTPGQHNPHAKVIRSSSDQIRLLSFNVNYWKMRTNFDSAKFLVYNDGYLSEWQAFIDGNEVDLWRANLAFKGLWVPKGEHIVHLRYGAPWRYVLNHFLLIMFFGVFVYFIVLTRRYIIGLEKVNKELPLKEI